MRAFAQVDVFTSEPYRGNPVAVVREGEGLSPDAMRAFTRWTNLSEATFVLPPTDARADYRVRIFTSATGSTTTDWTSGEMPFAGHPTLGTCHAWLAAGGRPRRTDVVVQECGSGLVQVCRTGAGLSFAAPGLIRSGSVDEALLEHIADVLRIGRDAIVDSQWVDNGPGWVAVLLRSADEVLALRPGFVDLDLGVVGPYAKRARGVRGLGVLPAERKHSRGSRHWKPERLPGTVAATDGSRVVSIRRVPRDGARPRRPHPHRTRCRGDGLGGRRYRHLHHRRGADLELAGFYRNS